MILVLGTAGSLLLPDDFLGSYNVFLVILLYSLIPWTAINLVDFFFVRRGDYAILEIFKPNGIYGAWNWRGLLSYVVGIAVMVPFFAIFNGDQEIFVGPVARSLDCADLSLFVGLPVSALLYWLLCRSLDLSRGAAAGRGRGGGARGARSEAATGKRRPPRHEAAHDLLDRWPVRSAPANSVSPSPPPTWRRGGWSPGRKAGVGAVATQSWPSLYLAIDALALMEGGAGAEEAMASVLADDPGRSVRQAGPGRRQRARAPPSPATSASPGTAGSTGRTSRPRATC